MLYYPYERFVGDVKALVQKSAAYRPDTLVAIARGGWTLGHAYASATDNRRLMSVNAVLYEGDRKGAQLQLFNLPDLADAKKVLILDDIVDSGETMAAVLKLLRAAWPQARFKTASLYYKSTASMQPDFTLHEATEWIEFFWEKDYL